MAEKDYTSLLLRSQICFPLYACSREIIKQYRPHLEALGLTYTQYITMMVVWEMQEISVKALGQQLHLDSGTLTPVLKALEAKGLLTRRRSPEDERVLLVSVTEEGMALREQALSVPPRTRPRPSISSSTSCSTARIWSELGKNSFFDSKSPSFPQTAEGAALFHGLFLLRS